MTKFASHAATIALVIFAPMTAVVLMQFAQIVA